MCCNSKHHVVTTDAAHGSYITDVTPDGRPLNSDEWRAYVLNVKAQ